MRAAHTELSKFPLRGRPLPRHAQAIGIGWALCLFIASTSWAADADEVGGLQLETGAPDALCPDLALTREAVRRRLGELVVPSGSGWRARYTIGHAPEGRPRDFVRLELFAPDGSQALERELPLEGESCSTMAEVIALVLDSHFRTLRVHDPQPAPPAAAAEPSAAAAGARAAEPATTSPSADAWERLTFVGLELGASSSRGLTVGGRALFELWPRIYAGTAVLLPVLAETEALDGGGEARARSLGVRAHLGWGPRWRPVRLYFGPGLRLTVQQGSGEGLPRDQAGYRAVWAAGIEAGLLWELGARAWLTFSGTLDASLTELGGQFNVDDQEVLRPEPLGGWLGVGLGLGF